jgi:UDP-N-acetylglucosamine:LPS N-acetylglucosamine transferase
LHIVISTIGTAGDIYPCIALGRALARRGHEVDFHGGAYLCLSEIKLARTDDEGRQQMA